MLKTGIDRSYGKYCDITSLLFVYNLPKASPFLNFLMGYILFGFWQLSDREEYVLLISFFPNNIFI